MSVKRYWTYQIYFGHLFVTRLFVFEYNAIRDEGPIRNPNVSLYVALDGVGFCGLLMLSGTGTTGSSAT